MAAKYYKTAYPAADKAVSAGSIAVASNHSTFLLMTLEKGKIIERGDHQELLEEKGRYYQLYTGKVELD